MNDSKKILIVEDEPAILRALVATFKAEGFETFSATNGEEGLRVGKEAKPDLIILDIVMPVMDGMAMLRRIREDAGEWGKRVKALIYSNLSYNEKREEASRIGVTNFLIKANGPLAELVKKVREELAMGSLV